NRVGLDEVVELVRDLAGETLIARELESLPERHPVLTPAQLPGVFDISVPRPHLVQVPFLVRHAAREPQSPHRIEIPINPDLLVCPSVRIDRDVGSAAEQIEFVTEN